MDNLTQAKEAIVLAGGFGTRLQKVVNEVPKPMAPVYGKPFLSYVLNYLIRYKYTHVVLATGYLHEKIEDYFGNNYKGLTIRYAQETTPLGTGGGILNALQYCKTEQVTVLNGDTLFCIDFSDLEKAFAAHTSPLTIVLRLVNDTSRYGSVTISDEGKIVRFTEKNATSGKGYINGGIYQLHKSLFADFKVGQTFSFEKDVLERYYQQLSFYAFPVDAFFIDIGIPEDYFKAQKDFASLF